MDRRRQLTWLKRALVPTFLIALFVASATIAWASESAAQATVNVEMRDNAFAPQNVTVNVGDTVTWTNVGQRAHNAIARNGAFTSPSMMNGQTFSWTATAAGTYEYVCTFHERGGMVATLVVQSAGGTGGAPTAPPRTGSGGMAGGQSPWFYLVLLVAGLGGSLGLLAGRRRSRSEQPSN